MFRQARRWKRKRQVRKSKDKGEGIRRKFLRKCEKSFSEIAGRIKGKLERKKKRLQKKKQDKKEECKHKVIMIANDDDNYSLPRDMSEKKFKSTCTRIDRRLVAA